MPRPLLFLTVLTALSVFAPSQTLLTRVNCGALAVTPQPGVTFEDDLPYAPGTTNGFVGGTSLSSLSGFGGLLLGGDNNPWKPVYDTARSDWTAYRFEVPNGDYIVRLLFAEILNQGVGLRFLNLSIEGVPVLTNLDLADLLEVQYGGVFATRVTVTDNRLDIEASPGPGLDIPAVEGPLLNGIEIYSDPGGAPAPLAPQGFQALSGYNRNILTWDWPTDPNIENFIVYRADAAAGPFVPVATIWNAPPRYFDDQAVLGTTHHYRITARNFDGVESPPSVTMTATASDPSASGLPVYEITIAPADLQFISRNIQLDPFTEVPATFTVNGVSHNAQVRFRGVSARAISKKAWKVKFAAGDTFMGRSELNLKSSFLDPSLLREPLAFSLHEDLQNPVANIGSVALVVNGEYLGVFQSVEQLEEEFLSRNGRSLNANVYKCRGNLSVATDPSLYPIVYEKKVSSAPGNADLVGLINFLDDPTAPDFERMLLDQVNVDKLLDYLVVVGYSGDLDSISNNYFLDHDLDLDRWEIWPFDSDVNFALVPAVANLSVVAGTSFGTPGFLNALRERVMAIDSLRWRFVEKLLAFVADHADPSILDPRIDALHQTIQAAAIADPFKQGWESSTVFSAQSPFIKGFIPTRNADAVAEAMSIQPPTQPTHVWINEISAANQTTFPDAAGDFEDWVELYNDSQSPIDVGGWFLTDDMAVPTKWQIPAGTMVPAQGYLIIFADNEPLEGPLHATFRLSSSGEELALFAADGTTVMDFAYWGPQFNSVSYGRRQDGDPFFRLLATQTPNAPNTDTGNLPPLVAGISHSPALPMSSDSATVTAIAEDADGIQDVMLFWRVDGGAFTSQPMTSTGGDAFASSIPPQGAGSLVEYYVQATDTLGAVTLNPKDAPLFLFSYIVTDPQPIGLRITEILASNDTVIADEAGGFDDYIEIHNETGQSIDLSGMFLTDDFAIPTKWPFPAGTILGADQYLLVWADNSPLDGPLHALFKLKASGEDVALFAADGVTLLDGFSFGQQMTDVALGPLPDTSSTLFRMQPSPAAPNLPLPGHTLEYNAEDVTQNVISLQALHALEIGYNFGTFISGAAPGQQGYIVFDFAPISQIMGTDGTLLVNPIPSMTQFFMTDAAGTGSWAATVPNLPSLVGITVYFQAFVTNSGLSNAISGTVGQQGLVGPTNP